ncbi:hypothetical protein BK120_18065 [Paenibacillus sp. FSL A5-0031]|uniref:glycosyltransferase family 4 protein n=1 Tax=Paenibacillus sp. FSL A5-0031 TaxID=1920420 RepID=UPI00096CEFF9|nr:glycosyltransferase family 4 protein [Paenibacillus sp. FSL A5-0031]OME80596.1 hypothetical protein BK120_18065 [Paenibacillus sp. FSL A5-0031]
MDIAIVSPSPKPFAMGGIEKLMLGLYQQIDELTDNRVELFKIPTEENGFWELIWSYKTFYELDLNHFDKIITCKYPAWMVQHKNHTVYMAHHLRGLFDTYHMLNLPSTLTKTSFPIVDELIAYTEDFRNINKDLAPFFEKLLILYSNKESYPEHLFAFPGPFIRMLVHFMDKWALHPSRIKKYTAISNTVKNRTDYFPDNVNVEVIYPPTTLSELKGGNYDYFLVVGRVDSAKRVELIIQAMMKVKNSNVRLLVAGSGPDESRLKMLASQDKRIEFIGYINNEKLKTLYSDALAVVYVPYDEDYGLVTIEAMHCGKPVITCIDSGGTTEFVINNQTGLIAKVDVYSLSEQMSKLANNVPLAIELGANARENVKNISWNNCVNSLLHNGNANLKKTNLESISKRKKEKITVLSTYPVWPRKHGGQIRIFNIYKNLSTDFEVTILSLNNEAKYSEHTMGNMKEISIPVSNKHLEKEWEIERKVGIPITDIVMESLLQYSPDFNQISEKYMNESDILVSEHPYLYGLFNKYLGKKFVVYDSHNIEYELKKSMLPENKTSKQLLKDLYEMEKNACLTSNLILSCSEEDSMKMVDLFEISLEKVLLAPNGVDVELNPFVNSQVRKKNKKDLGLENEKIIVFIGSWHKPNLEAVKEIMKLAIELPEYKFIIMGGQCLAFKDTIPSKNVVFAGIVSEELKTLVYSIADIAINPMITGSGTNLKVAEYMSCGLPVISTEVGARGYKLENQNNIITCVLDDFILNIKSLVNDEILVGKLTNNARKYIQSNYEWRAISDKIKKFFQNK